MTRKLRLRVASPCKVSWEGMQGEGAVRHCGACDKRVYNISEMPAADVEALLARPGESPCVRFHQRSDGTVMTGDCPVGARHRRRRNVLVGAGLSAAAALGAGFGLPGPRPAPTMGEVRPPAVVVEAAPLPHELPAFAEPPPAQEFDEVLMGEAVPETDVRVLQGRIGPIGGK